MISKLILGQEKAVVGGIVTALLTLLSQVGVNGQMTVHDALYALVAWIIAHFVIWLTTNTAIKKA